MKKEKKEIKRISLCGKLPNQDNQHGILNGEKEDQAGISNVPLWLHKSSAKSSIYTLEESI